MLSGRSDTTPDLTPRPTRRAVTRGAAWSVPVAAAVTAAPAFAASTSSPLSVSWVSATWVPGKTPGNVPDYWSFNVRLANVGSRQLTVTGMAMHSTYGAPATNGVADGIVQTPDTLGIVLVVRGSTLLTTSFVPRSQSGTPPEDAAGTVLLPSYYNHYPSGDGPTPCVSTMAYPKDATYPDSCRRLAADHTYLVFTYQVGSTTGSVPVRLDAAVGCLVKGNDCTT